MADSDFAFTSAQIKEMLRARLLDLSKPEGFQGGFFCDEVTHLATGRRADVLFLGMTNSKGRNLQGFEIKSSRNDWLRELRDVDKPDSWADECHSWTVVAPQGVVADGELPERFGLLEVRITKSGNPRLLSVVKPKVYENRTPSWEALHSFMSRMVSIANKEKKKAVAQALDSAKDQMDVYRQQINDLHTRINAATKAQELVDALAQKGIVLSTSWHVPDGQVSVAHFPDLMKDYLVTGEKLLVAVASLERSVRARSARAVNDAAQQVESELRMLMRLRRKLEPADDGERTSVQS